MKLAIITGVSNGLGHCLAQQMLKENIHVIGVSRTNDDTLDKLARKNNVTYKHYPVDLYDGQQIDRLINKLKEKLVQATPQYELVYVINNAATLSPIEQAHQTNRTEIEQHYQLNVTAPIVLLNSLLDIVMTLETQLIGVNVTSGAAERGISGWSAYCSSKAAINMYTETVALEQNERQTGHQVIAFSPGVMDTAMQAEIRATTVEQFPTGDMFRQYKASNQLIQPEDVARVLLKILSDKSSIQNGKIYRATNYLQ